MLLLYKLPTMATNILSSVPSSFLTNFWILNRSKSNCAESCKEKFLCPNFCTNPAFQYLIPKVIFPQFFFIFLKLCLSFAKIYLILIQQTTDLLTKIGLVITLLLSTILGYVQLLMLPCDNHKTSKLHINKQHNHVLV